MQPHKPSNTRKSADAALKRYIQTRLGWMEGFPELVSDGTSSVKIIWYGSSGETPGLFEKLELDRNLLRQTEYSLKATYRKFPKALPRLVKDTQLWQGNYQKRLELLKTVIHKAGSLPELPNLHPHTNFKRSTIETIGTLARTSPYIKKLLTALIWYHWNDEKQLIQLAGCLKKHVSIFTRLGEQDKTTLLQGFYILNIIQNKKAQNFTRLLADERSWSVAIAKPDIQKQLNKQLLRLRKNKRYQTVEINFSKECAAPPYLIDKLLPNLEEMILLGEKKCMAYLQLLDQFFGIEELDYWENWWQDITFIEKEISKWGHIQAAVRHPRNIIKKKTRYFHDKLKNLHTAKKSVLFSDVHATLYNICRQADEKQCRLFKLSLTELRQYSLSRNEANSKGLIYLQNWLALLTSRNFKDQTVLQLLSIQHNLLNQASAHPDVSPGVIIEDFFWFTRDTWLHGKEATRLIEPFYQFLVELIPDKLSDQYFYASSSTILLLVKDKSYSSDLMEQYISCLKKFTPNRQFEGDDWLTVAKLSEWDASHIEQLAENWKSYFFHEKTLEDIQRVIQEPDVRVYLRKILLLRGWKDFSELFIISQATKLFKQDVHFSIPEMPARKLTLSEFPEPLHTPIEELTRWEKNALESAHNILSKDFPDKIKMQNERKNIENILSLHTNENMPRKKRESLQLRINRIQNILTQKSPVTISDQRLKNLITKLDQRAAWAACTSWKRALTDQFTNIFEAVVGYHTPAEILNNAHNLTVLAAISKLPKSFQKHARTLLEARCLEPPWDLRDKPANKEFVRKMEHQHHIKTPYWLDGIQAHSVRINKHFFSVELERDPLEILRMGAHFETCLSPGDFNFFSALANCLDINKRVIYMRDQNQKVIARCLIVLADSGQILPFYIYAHQHEPHINTAIENFITQLAEKMQTSISNLGQVSNLVAPDWYNDGAIDLEKNQQLFGKNSDFDRQLLDIPPDKFLSLIRKTAGTDVLNPSVINSITYLPTFKQRPELALPLLPMALKLDVFPYYTNVLIGKQCRLAEETDAAANLFKRMFRDFHKYKNRNNYYYHPETELADELLQIEQPHLALRLIVQTRPVHIRIWEEEENVSRLLIAAKALKALNRPRKALVLYQLILKQFWFNISKTEIEQEINDLRQHLD